MTMNQVQRISEKYLRNYYNPRPRVRCPEYLPIIFAPYPLKSFIRWARICIATKVKYQCNAKRHVCHRAGDSPLRSKACTARVTRPETPSLSKRLLDGFSGGKYSFPPSRDCVIGFFVDAIMAEGGQETTVQMQYKFHCCPL